MTLPTAIWIALVALSTATVLALLGILSLRLVRLRRQRRHDRLVDEVRPLVLRSLEGDGDLRLDGRSWRVAEQVAQTLLGKLRGADRAALGDLLEERGVLANARRDLVARRAHRRLAAVELLGSAGDELSVPSLQGRLHDDDQDVRTAAVRALGRIGAASSVPDLLLAVGDRRVPAHVVTMAVLRIGPTASDAVADALDHEHPMIRQTAAQLAGVLGATSTVDRLVELLADPDVHVSNAAATAVGRLGLPRAAAPLVELLDVELGHPDDEIDVGRACVLVDALGRLGHRSAIPSLEVALTRGYRLSMAASAVLADFGPRRSRGAAGARRRADDVAIPAGSSVSGAS